MLKRIQLILIVLALCQTSLLASYVKRIHDSYHEVDPKTQVEYDFKYTDDQAKYELEFRIDGSPRVVESSNQDQRSWVFQCAIENRRGVTIHADRLKKGDFVLDPIKTVKGTTLIESGSTISEEDLIYFHAKSFRIIYDRSGTTLMPRSFKEGDVLNIYKRIFDRENQVDYAESGYQTIAGLVVIANGTTLKKSHLAMLRREAVLPVRVRMPVELKLDTYLRVNWPDTVKQKETRYWILREGFSQPLHLLSYHIAEMDVPVGNIVLTDKKIICSAGKPLTIKGPFNSIEVLDNNPHAIMVDPKGSEVFSIDPVSGMTNGYLAEPGELLLSPMNVGELELPFLVKSAQELDLLMLDDKHSYARHFAAKERGNSYPYHIFYTRYPVPYMRECVQGCDNMLDITRNLIAGAHNCSLCERKVRFSAPVREPRPAYAMIDHVWGHEKIVCGHCNNPFYYRQAHATAGPKDDLHDLDSQPINTIHPSRIRSARLPKEAELKLEAHYYRSGEPVVFESGTPANDELRTQLEGRPVSPVYVDQPDPLKVEMAQCPSCFGWNNKPRDLSSFQGSLGVDGVLRGAVSFKHSEERINKIELIVFGLKDDIDATSGRHMARCITYRRYGDEHFQSFTGWELTKTEWKFLPRYSLEFGDNPPISVRGGQKVHAEAELEDDLFE